MRNIQTIYSTCFSKVSSKLIRSRSVMKIRFCKFLEWKLFYFKKEGKTYCNSSFSNIGFRYVTISIVLHNRSSNFEAYETRHFIQKNERIEPYLCWLTKTKLFYSEKAPNTAYASYIHSKPDITTKNIESTIEKIFQSLMNLSRFATMRLLFFRIKDYSLNKTWQKFCLILQHYSICFLHRAVLLSVTLS